ncbi:aminoglycoside phosphotransferase family protein [Pseudolysinimonas sp.]|uniref:aminoglycoside phosphotransferase family protein n=1 Tax=Pseudolysinimonas sp. TaxID=2680009 RepID=UPI003F7F2A9C
MHEHELAVDVELVRRLVATQFPAWADLPVRRVAGTATVNAIFRIGDDLTARLPLRADAVADVAEHLRAEARALEAFAAVSPFPAPRPVAVGAPGAGYPLPWSVQTWLPGTVATPDGSAGSTELADDLAMLVVELRRAPADGRVFAGSGRGGVLTDHDDWIATCFAESEDLLDAPRLRRLWAALRALPRRGPDVMTHGDLHPGNLLLDDQGRLAGVLDGGGYGPADPALDLIVPWTLFEEPARERFRAAVGADDLEWARGAAWAFQQAMGLVWYYAETNPGMSVLGRRVLGRLQDDLFVRGLVRGL